MKRNSIDEGRISEDSRGVGTVTREMVLARARELAIINGRDPAHVLESDWEEARRELTGAGEESPREELLESVPESERWDPVPGSFGHRAPTNPMEDGQSESEKLVQEGVDDAEHEQMLEATEEAARRDRVRE